MLLNIEPQWTARSPVFVSEIADTFPPLPPHSPSVPSQTQRASDSVSPAACFFFTNFPRFQQNDISPLWLISLTSLPSAANSVKQKEGAD